jgi:hypothetical protein
MSRKRLWQNQHRHSCMQRLGVERQRVRGQDRWAFTPQEWDHSCGANWREQLGRLRGMDRPVCRHDSGAASLERTSLCAVERPFQVTQRSDGGLV